jgi:integration host factor subunit beta
MNKSDLIEALSQAAGLSHKKAAETINLIFDELTHALNQGERIEIRGFGSFMVKEYKTYVGRNPKSKESIVVPPQKLPNFKVGQELKARVNGETYIPTDEGDADDSDGSDDTGV